jgi:hypothetical protein
LAVAGTLSVVLLDHVEAFQPFSPSSIHKSSFLGSLPLHAYKTKLLEPSSLDQESHGVFSLELGRNVDDSENQEVNELSTIRIIRRSTLMLTATAAALNLFPLESLAAQAPKVAISTGSFDPASFQPVCSASDGFYRFLQGFTQSVVGPENFSEYGPLIAGGLLR